jgi:hypothetical protein
MLYVFIKYCLSLRRTGYTEVQLADLAKRLKESRKDATQEAYGKQLRKFDVRRIAVGLGWLSRGRDPRGSNMRELNSYTTRPLCFCRTTSSATTL